MVAMHQLAALCIATTTLAFVAPQGYKPSHRMRAAPEGADLEELWRAHSKPLLRVGARETKAHFVVRVKGDAPEAQEMVLACARKGRE